MCPCNKESFVELNGHNKLTLCLESPFSLTCGYYPNTCKATKVCSSYNTPV